MASPLKRVHQGEVQSNEERDETKRREEEDTLKKRIQAAFLLGVRLGITAVFFHRNAHDENMIREGSFEVCFSDCIVCKSLESKDVCKFQAFKKKILGLMGRVLFEIEQEEWDNFLDCCLSYSLKCTPGLRNFVANGMNIPLGDVF